MGFILLNWSISYLIRFVTQNDKLDNKDHHHALIEISQIDRPSRRDEGPSYGSAVSAAQ